MDKIVIDNNWLTTILSIAASAYIFLLGVPTIIFQTYMPEELREIYIKRRDTSKSLSSLRRLGWLLFLMIFVVSLGNIVIPILCQDMGNPSVGHPSDWKFDYILFLCYYCIVIGLLFRFSYKIYTYIMGQIKVGNVRKQIINAVMAEAYEYFEEHKQIRREDLQDFHVMGKSFSPG